MPYYCTVPRCTSMAGKAKNVSFHQFPRDEELAKLWNRVLKRGKPYTKYSKVCSLHFKPEDYTITSVGKNKGQWRTLRKDAVPSQNLPSEEPGACPRRYTSWVPSSPTLVDPVVQRQMAQAIYMQTMLAMRAAGAAEPAASNDQRTHSEPDPSPSGSSLSEIELLLRCRPDEQREETYQCMECSKCFKDPDVFLLHKRVHVKENPHSVEKENYSTNIQGSEETLRANPILANLLKSSMRLEPEGNILDASVLTVENHIMTALASNMEAYIRTLSSMLSGQPVNVNEGEVNHSDDDKCEGEGENEELGDAACEERCIEGNVSNSCRTFNKDAVVDGQNESLELEDQAGPECDSKVEIGLNDCN